MRCAALPISTAATLQHAIGDFNRAIALAPDFVPAYQNRGNAWYARGNYGEALEDYDTAIRLDPKAASAYVNRATVRRDLGVTDGALADYQQAIELGARAPAYSGRGQLYMRQQDYTHAIEDFDRAVRLTVQTSDNYMLRAKAHEADDEVRQRARRLRAGGAARSEEYRRADRASRHLAQEGRRRQGDRDL